MTGMRSNRPLLSASIHRVVSKVLAVCPGGLSLVWAPRCPIDDASGSARRVTAALSGGPVPHHMRDRCRGRDLGRPSQSAGQCGGWLPD
jgi:hypothetical protein